LGRDGGGLREDAADNRKTDRLRRWVTAR
jgi:hypothetical protein